MIHLSSCSRHPFFTLRCKSIPKNQIHLNFQTISKIAQTFGFPFIVGELHCKSADEYRPGHSSEEKPAVGIQLRAPEL